MLSAAPIFSVLTLRSNSATLLSREVVQSSPSEMWLSVFNIIFIIVFDKVI